MKNFSCYAVKKCEYIFGTPCIIIVTRVIPRELEFQFINPKGKFIIIVHVK